MLAEGARPVYAFGECEIDLARRELRVQGSPVPVGGRAFEIIQVLAQSAGQLVTKDELMDRVWPGAIINDNALQVHISAVRKALGARRTMLKTESGRGYRLLGDWAVQTGRAPAPPVAAVPRVAAARPTIRERAPTANFPQLATPLLGRSAALERLQVLLSAYRVLTLTGPGGIGKTTLALEAARSVLQDFADGACLVELAPLSDPGLVPSAVAGALGLNLASGEISVEAIARAVGDRNLLLILDNCEHVIDATADLTETIIRRCPRVTVLATSREMLRIDNEQVYRVAPLDVPATADAPDRVLGSSAVELFVARTREAGSDIELRADELTSVAAICRQLDGLPLAIEFAAGRAAALGVHTVAASLADRFAILSGGRRTALPRHRTLRAVLDWSYELLPEPERRVLCRLAMFAGSFTLQAANAIAMDDAIGELDVVDGIANLVTKSLVSADADGVRLRYRLLETTRAYGLQKLEENGERLAWARRHAWYCLVAMEEANAAWDALPGETWLAQYRDLIADVRAALDVTTDATEEAATAVALTVAAVPLWYQLSLLTECYQRASRALEFPATARTPIQEMRLHATVAWCLMQVRGSVRESRDAWTVVLHMARDNNDPDHQLRALWGLWAAHTSTGALRTALELAQEFSALAQHTTALDRGVGGRMMGHSLHLLGEQAAAREHLERMLANYTPPTTGAQAIRYVFDQQALALCFLARITWLQGYPDRAMQIAREVTASERAQGNELSLCQVLVQAACPIGLMSGDLVAVEGFVTELIDISTHNDWHFWRAFGECFRGVLLVQRGDNAAGLEVLEAALKGMRNIDFGVHYLYFLCRYARALGVAGRVDHALEVIAEAAERSDANDERWCTAEVLRIKGALLHQQGDRQAASAALAAATDWADRQGALAWSLRIATSAGRLALDTGRVEAARAELAAVCGRFTEGFDAADHRDARSVLAALEAGS